MFIYIWGMIKVKIQKLSGDNLRNDIAKITAREIEKDYRSVICDIHPKKISYLIITVKKKIIELKKGKFCCPEFSKTIKIK